MDDYNELIQQRFKKLAEISGRPVLYNVIQPRDNMPHVHRMLIGWIDKVT